MTTSSFSLAPSPFKDTPLGPLPEEWEIVQLGDLFTIQQGKSLSQKQREGKSPYPFLRTANVYWGKLDLNKLDEMDFSTEDIQRLRLRPGDLLVCEGGDIGRTAMWNGELEACFYQNHLHRLRTERPDVVPQFFMYWLQTAFTLLNLYGGEGNRTTIPNLSQSRLKSFTLPQPPVEEQRAIARVLSTVRQAIEASEQVIAAMRELKRSLMKHLFTYGPVSVADAGSVELKETEVGNVPEKWDIVRLEDVIELADYGINNRADLEGATPVLRMNNLVGGKVDTSSLKYVTLPPKDLERYHLAKGDILFNRTNSLELVGKTAIFDLDGDFVFASYLVRVKTQKDKLLPAYLNFYLNWETTQARLHGMATRGVSQSNISAGKLRTFQVPLPTLPEQEEIAKQILAVDSKLRVEQRRMAALNTMFESLLQQLMTAQLRIPHEGIGQIIMIDDNLIKRLIKLEEDICYQEIATENEGEFRYIPGIIPVLLSAPHGAVHTRNGKSKEEDEYTAGFARLVAELTGAHVIYARRKSETDPNHDDGAPYKAKLKEVIGTQAVRFVVDIHGIRADLDFGIALGTIGWRSCLKYKERVVGCLEQNGFVENAENRLARMVINHPEYSGGEKNHTVTRYCMNIIQVPAAQIELNAYLRIPSRRQDASQSKNFRGDQEYIVRAVRAIQNLTLDLASGV